MGDLALLWHFHQPSYVDAATGEVLMSWVRLHTVRGYADMAEMARRYPRVKLNFNLTPVLVGGSWRRSQRMSLRKRIGGSV